ncbi:4-hydroxyphenylacetate 3-monooxygenase, oxygenase component [Halobacillus salinus]|uniref:4-hydroxyphenylacetate 3-monooxygenase, oxygenase component n=1 Tax=Halobacillus salinus TaxID=192814 RepID=A0A4Z0GWT0_9BACI|nr:4-hydroxyphenylacetate 3-monooxygenase, oxygenase component [Halobacillus salinus]TGB02250.1 4-hydroxyphenylacetate 3-monooxygenase, oxygenase component [Halobacillus salinus]
MKVIDGAEYKRRIAALKSSVWYDGKLVEDITDHPAFRGGIQSQAELYDLQNEEEHQSITMSSSQFGTSYLIPRTKADLEKRRKLVQLWARHTAGMMGRSPDYMNTVLASFAASKNLLENEENCFPDRLQAFYEKAKGEDLSFTHTFINPQNNRASLSFLDEDDQNARIVDKTEEGLIIRGAKLLATQGGMTDEVIVYSAPGASKKEYAYLFSIPTDTAGLKFVCRSSFGVDSSRFNSPLSSRFEEMDSLVLFDDVLVPWERVFLYENIRAADQLYVKGKFTPMTLHQIVSRQVIKTEFVLGLAIKIVEEIQIEEYHHVQSKVAEMIKARESLKALLLLSENDSLEDEAGVMVPARLPLYTAINEFQRFYPRFTEILQLLGASGLVTLPSEDAFQSDLREDLNFYLRTGVSNGEDKVRLYRLAWDVAMSSFGSRQTLYERFFFGDPVRIEQVIYQSCNKESYSQFAEEFLHKKS